MPEVSRPAMLHRFRFPNGHAAEGGAITKTAIGRFAVLAVLPCRVVKTGKEETGMKSRCRFCGISAIGGMQPLPVGIRRHQGTGNRGLAGTDRLLRDFVFLSWSGFARRGNLFIGGFFAGCRHFLPPPDSIDL